MRGKRARRLHGFALGALVAFTATTASAHGLRVAVILDDLGEQYSAGERALHLDDAVALAFLPGSRHAAAQSARAAAQGHEILVHMPMEPQAQARAHPQALRTGSDTALIARRLRQAVTELPHASGINNHQGSRFTADTASVNAFMTALRAQRGLYFLDSRTTAASRAFDGALAHGIAAGKRDVFIDHERGADAVSAGWQRLLRTVRRQGSAIAIVHPYPESLELLERELPRLAAQGIALVPPSRLLQQPDALSARATSSTLPALH